MPAKKVSIRELTDKENRLFSEVICAIGSQEQIRRILENLDIFNKYRTIYADYCYLALETNNREALKRALFLQWQAVTDSPHMTGLIDFNIETQKRILARLNKIISDDKEDGELSWMLIHYYQHNQNYFNDLNGYTNIRTYCELNGDIVWPEGIPSINSLKDRGQMGYYWISHLLKIIHEML